MENKFWVSPQKKLFDNKVVFHVKDFLERTTSNESVNYILRRANIREHIEKLTKWRSTSLRGAETSR